MVKTVNFMIYIFFTTIKKKTHTQTEKPQSNAAPLHCWNSTIPGVSIRLILYPFQSNVTAADWIVMPRSRSWAMKSVTVSPSSTSNQEKKWHS